MTDRQRLLEALRNSLYRLGYTPDERHTSQEVWEVAGYGRITRAQTLETALALYLDSVIALKATR